MLIVRFTDEEAICRNSNPKEHGAWWAMAEQAFVGPVVFFDSSLADRQFPLAVSADEVRLERLVGDPA